MKRTNVVLDEKLLEDVRRESGERTYSGALTQAMREFVRVKALERSLDRFYAEAEKGDLFWPGYLEEIRPGTLPASRKRKISTDEKRAPRVKRRRGSR